MKSEREALDLRSCVHLAELHRRLLRTEKILSLYEFEAPLAKLGWLDDNSHQFAGRLAKFTSAYENPRAIVAELSNLRTRQG